MAQVNKIINEERNITVDTRQIQSIIKGYYKQLYNKLGKPQEVKKFLKTYNLTKSQEEIENLKRRVTGKVIESVI